VNALKSINSGLELLVLGGESVIAQGSTICSIQRVEGESLTKEELDQLPPYAIPVS